MTVEVSCYAGHTHPERPRHFSMDGQVYEVAQVIVEWMQPEKKGFRVRTKCGASYDLWYFYREELWQVERI